MGICVNCIWHIANETQNECWRRFRKLSGHQCSNPENLQTDYVTGNQYNGDCYLLNQFEECEKFDDGEEKVTFYAWKNIGKIIYTNKLIVEANDPYFENPEDKEATGTVTEAPHFYAWRNGVNIIFTKTLDFREDARTYLLDNTEDKEISKVNEGSITVEGVLYTRFETGDEISHIIVIEDKNFIKVDCNKIIKKEDKESNNDEEVKKEDTNENEEPDSVDPELP